MSTRKSNTGPPAVKPAQTLDTSQVSSSAITIDLVKYAHHLDGLDLTEEQAQDLLQTLSDIAWSFIALGYNVHPVQQIKKTCGKNAVISDQAALEAENQVSLLGQFIEENYTDFADPDTERIGERVDT